MGLLYSQALAERAAAWLAQPLNEKRSGEGLTELGAIWAATQRLPPVSCRQCQYSDRVHDLTAYLRDYPRLTPTLSVMAEDTQQTATYQFVPAYAGQTLTADDYGKAVTADNLTDEDAEHFIKKGFGHVFQRIGAAIVGAGEKLEGAGDGLAGDEEGDEPTEREQELQAKLEQATAAVDKAANEVDEAVAARLAANEALHNEQQAHATTTAALDSEKQAHATTQAQLSEVQQQLTEAQNALAAATAPKPKKAPAVSTDASADAATGSN